MHLSSRSRDTQRRGQQGYDQQTLRISQLQLLNITQAMSVAKKYESMLEKSLQT